MSSIGSVVGVKETYEDLFTHLQCALHFDCNPLNELFMVNIPAYDEYNPHELPASIGLYGVFYTIVFSPGVLVSSVLHDSV